MYWSVSDSRTYKRCPRQWYFARILANARAKNGSPRKYAFRLGKLQSISQWRGDLVDTVLSKLLVSSHKSKKWLTQEQMKKYAKDLFDRQLDFARSHRVFDDGIVVSSTPEFAAFYCIEYGDGVVDSEIEDAWSDVEKSIHNFYAMDGLLESIKSANYLISQRPLSFPFADFTVRAIPDLIAFYSDKPPLIIDWKVHTYGIQEAWLQLGIYALVLSKIEPHIDFPNFGTQFRAIDIPLWEVQLLTNQIRKYRLTEEDVENIETYIASTALHMKFSMADIDSKKLEADDFPMTEYPEACQSCGFKKICWEAGNE